MPTSVTIKELANKGANIHMDGSYTSVTIKEVARIVKTKGTHLTLNGKELTSVTLKEVATILGDQLTVIV